MRKKGVRLMAFKCKRKVGRSKRKVVDCKGCKYWEKVYCDGR